MPVRSISTLNRKYIEMGGKAFVRLQDGSPMWLESLGEFRGKPVKDITPEMIAAVRVQLAKKGKRRGDLRMSQWDHLRSRGIYLTAERRKKMALKLAARQRHTFLPSHERSLLHTVDEGSLRGFFRKLYGRGALRVRGRGLGAPPARPTAIPFVSVGCLA